MVNFHEEALAIPYRVEFVVPYVEMKEAFDQYWEKNSTKLIDKYKPQAKKSKGGTIPKDKARKMIEANIPVSQIYSEALAQMLIDLLAKEGRELFLIDALNMYDYVEGKDALLIGRVYYWPKMKLRPDAEIKFEAKVPFKPDFDKAWQGKEKELWHKHRKVSETELESGPVLPNHELLMDIIASCDGQPYEKGTSRGTWFELRTLNPELRESCQTHSIGDLFETNFNMSSMDPEKEGLPVHATIKIFKAREITYQEVGDELAKEEGFDSLEALRESFRTQYQNYVQNVRNGTAADAVLQDILKNSEMPAIPDTWMERTVQRLINNHLAQFKEDIDKAKASVGAQSEEHFRQLFQGEVTRDVLQKLSVRLYKELYDLSDATEESMYQDMVNRVHWIDEVAAHV